MKSIISALLLLLCFGILAVCLFLRSNIAAPVPAQFSVEEQIPITTTEPAAAVSSPPVTESFQPIEEPKQDTEDYTAAVIEAQEPDYLSAYSPVFRSYRLWLAGNEPTSGGGTDRGDYFLSLGETGISYLCRYVETLGYVMTDMDANGIPELIIGSTENENYNKTIFDMFTLVNGLPQRVLVSSERVYYMLYQGNQILHRGSGGAGYNFAGLYRYSGTEIQMTYGLVMTGDNTEYYQVNGEAESIFTERLPDDIPITREEYFAKVEELETNTVPLQLLPLN